VTGDDATKTGLLFTDHASGTLKARRYRIAVVAGPDSGASAEVDNGTFLLGTHQNNDLRLTDKGVSRYHLELQLRAEGLKVTDLESTNGTFQGSTKIGSITLNGAARLKLGSHTEVEIQPADVPVQLSGFDGERFGQAIGGSRYMKELFGLLDRVANTEATVLLEGETGTGKELLAEAIHRRSARRGGAFVVVDCGALPRDLIGSELFGHVRGAFTGALTAKRGLIEEADGGTLFLDEVGELPLDLQPQLLRALEKREVRPIGEVRAKKVNIRVVAATNRNLPEQVRSGAFREDLYLSAGGGAGGGAGAAQAQGGHPAPGATLPVRAQAQRLRGRPRPSVTADDARVAGQRPRAAQCRGAGAVVRPGRRGAAHRGRR
jgi:transcriptional regulator of acetoin/glycerol metabolism